MRTHSVVCFVVLALIALTTVSVGAGAQEPMRATVDANSLFVKAPGVEVAEYRFGDVPFKPYLRSLTGPNGLNVLLDAPHDHLHHHALMFAVAVDGVNFWEETPTAGRQKHLEFTNVVEGEDHPHGVGFAERLEWVAPSEEKLLSERRTVFVTRGQSSGTTFLTWESHLTVPEGKSSVTLTGSHYFGLGLRFIRAMDSKGAFRNADNEPGTVFRGEERLVRSNWCAYTAHVDGEDVTVAMFGHPENPRSPTTWFTMAQPFAYLSATLGLHEKPLEIVEGKPLTLRYALWLWGETVESEEIDRLYQRWSR